MKIKVFPADSSDFVKTMSKTAHSLNLLLFSGLCILLAFGPLALGAVHEWAIFTIEAGAAVLFVIWALREMASDQITVTRNPLFIPIALFALLVVTQLVLHRTAYWYATWVKALLWAAYGLIFFLVSQTVRGTKLWTSLGIFLSVYGALVALFAIAQQFAGNGKIYWIMSNQLGWIYGPYVHHAHYAGLMEMLVPIPLVLAIARVFPRPAQVLLAFAALVMASTIFLSQSLGGILAFCAQLLLLFFCSWKVWAVPPFARSARSAVCAFGRFTRGFAPGGPCTSPRAPARPNRPGRCWQPNHDREGCVADGTGATTPRLGPGDFPGRLSRISKFLQRPVGERSTQRFRATVGRDGNARFLVDVRVPRDAVSRGPSEHSALAA